MPFVAIDAQRFATPAYQETTALGGSSYALAIKSQDKNQLFTDLGLRIDPGVMNDSRLDFQASLAWRHVFSPSQSASANFLVDPASSFRVLGSPLDSDAAVTSVTGEMHLSSSLSLSAAFSGDFGGNSSRYGASAMLRQAW
jgi:uncharacterized protein with beta-barrel porin domain